MIEIETIVSVGQSVGKNRETGVPNLPNITLQKAKFFGRPNFAGEINRFKEDKRQFTVLVPNETADALRQLGYNVKTNIPTPEELREYPDRGEVSHLKVVIDEGGADVFIKMGDGAPQILNPVNWGVVDRSRIAEMDMELRAWMYNDKAVKAGEEQPKYSARLVTIYVTIEHNLLAEKYGNLG